MNPSDRVVEKDKHVEIDNVDNAVANIDSQTKEDILGDFQSFKKYLGERIQLGERFGLNDEQLATAAQKVADYLASHEEPRNREEKLLQELWKTGKQEEQHMLAHMLVRLAKKEN